MVSGELDGLHAWLDARHGAGAFSRRFHAPARPAQRRPAGSAQQRTRPQDLAAARAGINGRATGAVTTLHRIKHRPDLHTPRPKTHRTQTGDARVRCHRPRPEDRQLTGQIHSGFRGAAQALRRHCGGTAPALCCHCAGIVLALCWHCTAIALFGGC
jgi:hypothetical protein